MLRLGREHTAQERAFQVADAKHLGTRQSAALNRTTRRTVQRNCAKLKTYGHLESLPRSGRPRKCSEYDLLKIEALARTYRRLSLKKLLVLVKQKKVDISLCTLRKRLEELDYRRYKARRKPFLTAEQRQARLDYIADHAETDWKEVSAPIGLETRLTSLSDHLYR